jgi:[ribosomal protein S5]-alanine N-acetyltransferase
VKAVISGAITGKNIVSRFRGMRAGQNWCSSRHGEVSSQASLKTLVSAVRILWWMNWNTDLIGAPGRWRLGAFWGYPVVIGHESHSWSAELRIDSGRHSLMDRRTYRTPRLVLRPFSPDDYEVWKSAYTSAPPKRHKYDWFPNPKWQYGKRDFQKVMARHKKLAFRDHTYVWPIFERKTGVMIGSIDIYVISRGVLQFANLGYRIDNRYWRKGYGKEAVGAIIRGAFADLKLNRLEAVIDIDNRPSIVFARTLGMYREGVRRKYYYQNRGWADQVVFVANREDFGFRLLHPV